MIKDMLKQRFSKLCLLLKKAGYTRFKIYRDGLMGYKFSVSEEINDKQGFPVYWDCLDQSHCGFGGGSGLEHQMLFNIGKMFEGIWELKDKNFVKLDV